MEKKSKLRCKFCGGEVKVVYEGMIQIVTCVRCGQHLSEEVSNECK